MYYALHDRAHIRPEDGFVVAYRSDQYADLRYYHPVYGFMFALLDGTRSLEEVAQITSAVFSQPVELLLENLRTEIRKAPTFFRSSASAMPLWATDNDPAHFIMAPKEVFYPKLKAPLILCLILTTFCNRDCSYCCMPITNNYKEASTMQADLAFKVLREGAKQGARTLILHGGEPSLLPYSLDLIRTASQSYTFVELSTKSHFTPSRARAFAEAGLREIQFSIDSADPAIADALVRRKGFFKEAMASIANLQDAGIRVTTNTVVTPQGTRTIPDLLERLIGMGVDDITITGYLETERAGMNFKLTEPEWAWLEAQIHQIEKRYGDRVAFHGIANRTLQETQIGSCTSCTGGKSGLAVMPDGSVSFCDRLAHLPDFTVGDFNTQSLMDTWTGKELRRFVSPTPEEFPSDSPCLGCRHFQYCNARGRCAYKTYLTLGVPFGPDNCPFAAQYESIVEELPMIYSNQGR